MSESTNLSLYTANILVVFKKCCKSRADRNGTRNKYRNPKFSRAGVSGGSGSSMEPLDF